MSHRVSLSLTIMKLGVKCNGLKAKNLEEMTTVMMMRVQFTVYTRMYVYCIPSQIPSKWLCMVRYGQFIVFALGSWIRCRKICNFSKVSKSQITCFASPCNNSMTMMKKKSNFDKYKKTAVFLISQVSNSHHEEISKNQIKKMRTRRMRCKNIPLGLKTPLLLFLQLISGSESTT